MAWPAATRLLALLLAAACGLLAGPPAVPAQQAAPAATHGAAGNPDDDAEARRLMRMMDELWRGKTSQAVMTMTVQTARYTRAMRMEAWSEGKTRSLVRILEPKKDRGITTLKVDENIWNYLPKINRVTKIPPSMMMGAWMGSHFTNDDLVKESSFEDDYASAITFSGERDGVAIWEITSRPRPNAVVVWGKVVTEIAQATRLPLRALYHDEEGRLARVMTFEAPRDLDGRHLPTRLVLRPQDKPEESTVVVYESIRFDVNLLPDLFSLRELRR